MLMKKKITGKIRIYVNIYIYIVSTKYFNINITSKVLFFNYNY